MAGAQQECTGTGHRVACNRSRCGIKFVLCAEKESMVITWPGKLLHDAVQEVHSSAAAKSPQSEERLPRAELTGLREEQLPPLSAGSREHSVASTNFELTSRRKTSLWQGDEADSNRQHEQTSLHLMCQGASCKVRSCSLWLREKRFF